MAWEFWQYWYYNIPNYLLAAVTYTLLGRLLLSMFLPEDWDNYIWQAFRRLTNPVLAAVRFITPQAVPFILLMPLGAVWVHLLRVLFTVAMVSAGYAPIIDNLPAQP